MVNPVDAAIQECVERRPQVINGIASLPPPLLPTLFFIALASITWHRQRVARNDSVENGIATLHSAPCGSLRSARNDSKERRSQ
ncbi:hypothetical protein KKD19_03925 [Patescibacteria group bacterium]|nr:hypothetical protein [Patescibacteria group bacterium]